MRTRHQKRLCPAFRRAKFYLYLERFMPFIREPTHITEECIAVMKYEQLERIREELPAVCKVEVIVKHLQNVRVSLRPNTAAPASQLRVLTNSCADTFSTWSNETM